MTGQPRTTRRSRAAKQREVDTIERLVGASRLLVLLQFEGVNSVKTEELRRAVRRAGGRYRVVKNTLARRALRRQGSPLAELVWHGASALLGFGEDPLAGWAEFERYLSREFPVLLRRERRGPRSTQEGMDGKSAYRNDPFRTMVNELNFVASSLDGARVELETLARLVALGGEKGVRAALLSVLSTPAQQMLGCMQAPALSCVGVLQARVRSRAGA